MKVIDEKLMKLDLDYHALLSLVEKHISDHGCQKNNYYTRKNLELTETSLTYNYGESKEYKVFGFRVYPSDKIGFKNADHLTVVYDSNENKMKGFVVGEFVGALKTALTSTLAIKNLYKGDQTNIRFGIIGSGIQAEYHANSIVKILDAKIVYHFSKTKNSSKQFADKLNNSLGIQIIECASSWEVVSNCDVLITATDSIGNLWDPKPIPAPLKLICHIGTKYNGSTEVPFDCYAKTKYLYTDSLTQLADNKYKLSRIGELLPSFKHFFETGNTSNNDKHIIYLSQGISGIEVVLANWFLLNA